MGTKSIDREAALESVVDEKIALPTASTDNAITTEEEKAQRDAKLRPEREAVFSDYIVRASPSITTYLDIADAGLEDLQICYLLGFRSYGCCSYSSRRIRCRTYRSYK